MANMQAVLTVMGCDNHPEAACSVRTARQEQSPEGAQQREEEKSFALWKP